VTFKYAVTLAAQGGNKLARFQAWAATRLPDLDYRLPPQTPIKTGLLTVRLRSPEDVARLRSSLPPALP
jgi:hypothetical protein